MKKIILPIIVALAIAVAVYAAVANQPSASDLQQRLDLLVDELEQQRQTHHVPGMAIGWSWMTKWSSLMASGLPMSRRKRR